MKSFPILERLYLHAPHNHSSGFLGGSAVASRKLRYIVLERVIVPTLLQLLSSSRGLIRLYLGKDVSQVKDTSHQPSSPLRSPQQ